MKRGIDYIGVGVGAAIFNDEGKLFITLRGKKAKNERGKWEIPGGSVEFGECLEDAIKREVQEEYGVEIEVIKLLGVCNHLIPEEKQHWVAPTFICKITKGEPKIMEPEKCDAVGWFSLDEAEKLPLSIVTKYDIQELRKQYPNGMSFMRSVKPGKYLHYKGSEARVIGVASHSETHDPFVVYEHIEAETGKNKLWIRPLAMFLEDVEIDGKKTPRFKYLGE